MPRPLFDSPYLFGIHESGGEQEMIDSGHPGWILFTEEVGHDPNNTGGKDFSAWSDQDLGVICRINHGYEPSGTLPPSSLYQNFAVRCANYVKASKGCKIWIIGNEPNLAVERPGVQIDWSRAAYEAGNRGAGNPGEDAPDFPLTYRDLPDRFSALMPGDRSTRRLIVNPGEIITPQLYAQCYRLCRAAIHAVSGHEDDQVLVAPVAPWNIDTMYPGNPSGDWITYFQDILRVLGPENCDGITLHSYAHGTDLNLIYDDFMMGNPAYSTRRYQFRAYRDFMEAVPANMRHLPAYITESNQNAAWLDQNIGWIQRAYGEVDHWNKQPGNQQIRSLILYRWPKIDPWYIEGKQGVIDDFRQALTFDYKWAAQPSIDPAPAPTPADLDYGVEWVQVDLPQDLQPGQTFSARVTVKNTGSFTWAHGGDNPARLGFKFYDEDRPVVLAADRDLRTYLPKDVAVGESVTVDAAIATPTQPGRFILELDLMHFVDTWFGDNGAHFYETNLQVGQVAPPAGDTGDLQIVDIVDQMPVGTSPYQPRDLSQIKYLVINHTAVRPNVDLALIANAHVQRGYPGIAYDFVVDDRGRIFQVAPLEGAVRADQEWSGQGINVCLAGNFSETPPPAAQINAAGQLCAWLAGQFGLTANAIVGVGELLSYESPGRTFYEGPTWKNTLKQIVAQRLQETPAPVPVPIPVPQPQPVPQPIPLPQPVLPPQPVPQPDPQPDGQIQALQARIQQLLTQIGALQTENQRLQDRINSGGQGDDGPTLVVQPPIEDVILSLPRDATGFFRRTLDEIKYIVINHTAVDPAVSVERIAQAHRARLPGLLYQFYVDAQGGIFQTEPLMDVVDASQPYIKNGINVAFAGNFANTIPTEAQLRAGGQLIAWLIEQFPQLKPEVVLGVREFIAHSSPGDQWTEGRNWKAMLLAAIQNAQRTAAPAPGSDNAQVQALRTQIVQLQQQVLTVKSQLQSQSQAAADAVAQAADLEQQLRTLENQYEALDDRYRALQAANQSQQGQIVSLQAEVTRLLSLPVPTPDPTTTPAPDVVPSGPPPVTQPPMIYKADRLTQHPTLRYGRRSLNQITHIAVHHTAIRPDVGPERIAELHVMEDLSRGKEAWPGIGYHFFIHDDGSIDQCNDLETVSYQVYRCNDFSLGIVLAGSFMNGVTPTDAQLHSLAHLVAWLMQELHLPLQNLWGHREFPNNATVCPGSEWSEGKRWRNELFARIQQVQSGVAAKPLQHYLLFWQRGFPGPFAEADLLNAMQYIRRFRPDLGFSVDDAMRAKYVTIVGGDAGVSGGDEQRLRDAGCVVERIAGRDETETAQMLAAKVQSGRRHSQMDPEV